MAPFGGSRPWGLLLKRDISYPHGRASMSLSSVILEGWSQGVFVGGLLVLIMFTIANMRRRVLLHRLILLELVIALGHGTFIFFPDPIYGWYLSCTATLLYISFVVHNIVSWIKIKPFLPLWGSKIFIATIFLVIPYWIVETIFNFEYFNDLSNNSFVITRPWEVAMRDGWWIFTTCRLVYIIKHSYNISLGDLIKESPRFGVLITSMLLSIAFVFVDIAVTIHYSTDDGVNPYWKLYIIFKCAADVIFLDDFKKVVDSLFEMSMGRLNMPAGLRGSSFVSIWPQPTEVPVRRRISHRQESNFLRPFGSSPGCVINEDFDPVWRHVERV